MNCAEIDRLLPAFADGEFEGGEEVEFGVHVEHCDVCRQKVDLQQAFRSALRVKSQMAAPSALRNRIRRDVSYARLTDQAQRYAVYLAVAASMAGFVTLIYIGIMPRPVDAETLVSMSQHAGSLPSDFKPADGDVAAFTVQQVGFNPGVPTSGIQGVRVLPVPHHNGIMYSYGAEPRRRATLMVFADVPEFEVRLRQARPLPLGRAEILLTNHQGHNVAVVHKDGLVYSLVTDLDERDIVQILRFIDAR